MLRPFWKDQNDFSEEDRVLGYGDWVREVEIVDDEENSQLAVLPMSWNYYRANDLNTIAIAFIKEAKQAGLTILSWTSGDAGVEPLAKDVWVFRSSGYLSSRGANQFAFPVFFNDPLERQGRLKNPVIRTKGDLPVVGFCGQAYAPFYKNGYDFMRNVIRNFSYYLTISSNEPQQFYPSTLIRRKVISRLQRDAKIKTNFIIRKAYRAGAKSKEEKNLTTREYFQNMIDSDYIVCVRGNGNFSARLYETMAMGRIPIIINTDCIYPWDELLDWKKLGVWVDQDESKFVAEKIATFHRNVSDEEFENLQWKSRRIWEEYLSMSGFFSTLLRKFT